MFNNDWLSILSLVIAVIALLINYFSLRYSRQRVLLEQRKYEDLKAETARRRFDIAIEETIKEEFPKHKPCSMWAAELIVTNRTNEPVLVNELIVQLGFRQWPPPVKQLLREILWPSAEQGFSLHFSLYEPGLSFTSPPTVRMPLVVMPHWDDIIHQSIHLINWETRQPICFDRRHGYRGPAPGEKEIWMLFGKIPTELAKYLFQHGLHLATIRCQVHTDQGVVTASGSYAIGQGISDAFVAELDQIAATVANNAAVATD